MYATVRIPFIVRDTDTDTVKEAVKAGTIVEVLHQDHHEHLHKIQLASGIVCSVGTSRLEFSK